MNPNISVEESIIHRIKTRKKSEAFCLKDFLDFADYKTVAKALERLSNKGTIRRILRGIYDVPVFNKTLGLNVPPSIESVAYAISRNNSWEIIPSGNTALNILGLSTQVPANYVFISSGMYRKYKVLGTTIEFKRGSSSKFKARRISGVVFQGLRTIGDKKITQEDIEKIRYQLSDKEKKELLEDAIYAPRWMHPYAKEIGGEIKPRIK